MTLEQYSKSATVDGVLVEAGLEHLTDGFRDIDIDSFRSLMIQDYEKYGVYDVEDKQALFKVIKDFDTYVSLYLSTARPEETVPPALHKDTRRLSDTTSSARDDSWGDDIGDLLEEQDKNLEDGQFMDLSVDPSFLLDDGNFGISDVVVDCGDLIDDLNDASQDKYPLIQSHSAKHVGSLVPPLCQRDKNSLAPSQEGNSESGIFHITDPPRIRVIVRKRPLNSKEMEKGEVDVIQCDPNSACLSVHEPKTKVDMTRYIETHQFRFDDVFDADVNNDSLYIQAVRPLIATVFKSGRGTCFAYGQTGSGKTYTMQPLPLRAASDIFRITQTISSFKIAKLYVSCYEIYGGKIFDLLNNRQRLEAREDAKRRVQVVGLKETKVNSLQDLSRLCDHAACSRSTGSTGANDESSRSHSIMTFSIKMPREEVVVAEPARRISGRYGKAVDEVPTKTIGKLSFIDLAGSERGADTYDNDKQTRLEGAEINKSLLALKECIRALDMDAGHVPFRGSKLTSVLRDSFIGKNARTVMIANISPSSSSCEHTLNTLRYADRVKEMKKESTGKSQRRSSTVPADNISQVLVGLPIPEVPEKDGHAANRAQDTVQPPKSARKSSGPSTLQKKNSATHARTSEKIVTKDHKMKKNPVTDANEGHSIVSKVGPDLVTSNERDPQADFYNTIDQHDEDDLAYSHRQHIEDTMILLRQEMDLLAKLDETSPHNLSMGEYVEELGAILAVRLEGLSSLQKKVHEYRAKIRSKLHTTF